MKTNEDLFKFSLRQLESFEAKKIGAEDCKGVAGILRQANNNLRYEIEKADLKMKLHTFNKQNNTNIELNNIEND